LAACHHQFHIAIGSDRSLAVHSAEQEIAMTRLLMLCAVVALVCSGSTPAFAQTYDFTEVDAYTAVFPHTLPNGFDATGTGYTEMTGTYLRAQGGSLTITVPITVVSSSWKLTVHYLHFPGCSSRELFLIQETTPGFQGYIHESGAALNGVFDNTFVPQSNTWYTMEVINDSNTGTAEMRVWKDGDVYPTSANVTVAATGALADLIIRYGNFCAPERYIDYLSLEELSTVNTETSTWGQVKSLFAN
jgi:hypothetical protein